MKIKELKEKLEANSTTNINGEYFVNVTASINLTYNIKSKIRIEEGTVAENQNVKVQLIDSERGKIIELCKK